MKRKLAFLMALIMAFSMMPMNAFGARPGRITTTLQHPEWNLRSHTFRIDANALSRLVLDENTQAVLEFSLANGGNGSVGFAMPFDRRGVTLPIPNHTIAAGAVVTEAAVVVPGMAVGSAQTGEYRNQAALLHLIQQAGPQFTFRPGPDFEVRWDTGGAHNPYLQNAVMAALNASPRQIPTRPTIAQDGTLTSSANWNTPGGNGFGWNGHYANHPAPHNVFFRDLTLTLLDRDTPVGRQPIQGIARNANGAPALDEEGNTWEINPQNRQGWPIMNGWIEIDVTGIRADADDAEANIVLLQGGNHGQLRRTNLLTDFRFNERWHNGVHIASTSVVPMDGTALLSGITIREDRPGALVHSDASGASNVRSTVVRLVAPHGFRWDAGTLIGIAPQVTFAGNVAVDNATITPIVRHNFTNEFTNRNELIMEFLPPNRALTFAGRTAAAEFTIRGLALIPVRNAATTGNVAIDVFVGQPSNQTQLGGGQAEWQTPGWNRWGIANYGGNERFGNDYPRGIVAGNPEARAELYLGNDEPSSAYFRGRVAGSPWVQHDEGGHHWRTTGLVVATFDFDGDISISGPDSLTQVRSGAWSSDVSWFTNVPAQFQHLGYHAPEGLLWQQVNNRRWLNGANHTIRIEEVIPNAILRRADRWEFVPAEEGARIVDARVRIGRVGEADAYHGWQALDSPQLVESVGYYEDDGSVTFFPRTRAEDGRARLRTIEMQMVISVSAGYEQDFGTDVDVRVYRNGVYVDTVTIANVYDPIRVDVDTVPSINRDSFDILPLTPAATFTITEANVGELEVQNEIRFRLQAVQNGVEITGNFQQHLGEMSLWLSDPITNFEESGFEVRTLPGNQLGVRVQNPSNGVPGTITFEEVHVSGPTIPGIEWNLVVYSIDLSENSHLILGDTPFRFGALTGTDATRLAPEIRRGRFYHMPYSNTLLDVTGRTVIEIDELGPDGAPIETVGIREITRRAFTASTMINVDGHYIQAVAFPSVGPGIVSSMMNPRVFADFVGASVDWNEATRTATFTGRDTHGSEQTVVLTLDSPVAMVNGNPVDIATGAGQSALAGQINPVVIQGRSFVPARFLAGIFGIPIDFVAGTVILG